MKLFNMKNRLICLVLFAMMSGLAGPTLAQTTSDVDAQQPVTGPQMDALGRLQAVNAANNTVTVDKQTYRISRTIAYYDARNTRVGPSAFRSGEPVSFVFEFNNRTVARPENVKPENGVVVEIRKVGGF